MTCDDIAIIVELPAGGYASCPLTTSSLLYDRLLLPPQAPYSDWISFGRTRSRFLIRLSIADVSASPAARRDRKAAAGSDQGRSNLQAENDRLRRQLDQQTTVVAQPAQVTTLNPPDGVTSLIRPRNEIDGGR
jgi:hypothetical protein